jgi:hypothetical protein
MKTGREAKGVRRDVTRDVRRKAYGGACGVAWAALLLLAPAIAGAQVSPPVPPPGQQPPAKRRALEIRGQAPAPEVVTVRPREVPAYTRRIIVPALFDTRPATARRTVVLLPGPLPGSIPGSLPVRSRPPGPR